LNTTISGNIASSDGGGIHTQYPGAARIEYCTFVDNQAGDFGGGVHTSSTGVVTIIQSSVFKGNTSGEYNRGSCGMTSLTSEGGNIADDRSCEYVFTKSTDRINTDPLLGPLQDNGGPTHTYALLSGSPAINKGFLVPI